MAEIVLQKLPNGTLAPVDQDGINYLSRKKIGAGFRAKITEYRNYRFHKKFFALLDYAFDMWEPGEIVFNGHKVQKNRDRFRENVTIAAGFYEVSTDLNGEVRLSAKSISFASMDQEEFERLYSAVIDVVLEKILTEYTREDLDNCVNQIMGFA